MRLKLSAIVLLAFTFGALAAVVLVRQTGGGAGWMAAGRAPVGGPFTLTDHSGRRVSERDYRGRHMLVFFGFTHCPDVCPTGLQTIAAALDKLGAKSERITPLFISVDPERDTPQALASYVASFHPRLVGLTGSAADIAAAAKAYRVYYARSVDEKSSAGYSIDHSTIIYLMGPDGAYVSHFAHTMPADSLAAALTKAL